MFVFFWTSDPECAKKWGMDRHNSSAQPQDRDVVRGVEVRPVNAREQPLWDELMQEHHYLGFQGMIGESLRYVAAYRGRWLALLGWSGAALKCGVRERWIGWTPALKLQRLPLPANNCRFLILPGVRVPHPASRILALNLRRLSDDWQLSHGHPVWVAETFVDPQRYRGTCYRAAGWTSLGMAGGVATPDALHTQQDTARYLVEEKKPTTSSRSKITSQLSRHTSKISTSPMPSLTIRQRTKATVE
jgi:hypothetical protein